MLKFPKIQGEMTKIHASCRGGASVPSSLGCSGGSGILELMCVNAQYWAVLGGR
jgi:hypothetical protein